MVIDKPAYNELIDYLNSSREIFHQDDFVDDTAPTLEELIENQLAEQIITLCTQHDDLEQNHRSIIVREVDGIVYDLQQVLSEYWQQHLTAPQIEFVKEYTGLIKNVFDSAVAELMD
jgi:hypothetical protein